MTKQEYDRLLTENNEKVQELRTCALSGVFNAAGCTLLTGATGIGSYFLLRAIYHDFVSGKVFSLLHSFPYCVLLAYAIIFGFGLGVASIGSGFITFQAYQMAIDNTIDFFKEKGEVKQLKLKYKENE